MPEVAPITLKLPFEPQGNIRVMQGWNGPFSHNVTRRAPGLRSNDLSYAIDFALPFGTNVRAAARGRVFSALNRASGYYLGVDASEASRMLTGLITTNQVLINHPDQGIATRYSHLDGNSFRVQDGDEVAEGQVIARTGLSGWVGPIPHLHFDAEHLGGQGQIRAVTVPVFFEGYPGPYEHAELMAALKKIGLSWEEFFADLLTP